MSSYFLTIVFYNYRSNCVHIFTVYRPFSSSKLYHNFKITWTFRNNVKTLKIKYLLRAFKKSSIKCSAKKKIIFVDNEILEVYRFFQYHLPLNTKNRWQWWMKVIWGRRENINIKVKYLQKKCASKVGLY